MNNKKIEKIMNIIIEICKTYSLPLDISIAIVKRAIDKDPLKAIALYDKIEKIIKEG